MPRQAARTAKKSPPRGKKPVAKKATGKIDPQGIADKVLIRLAADYPDVTCALENESAFELLIATILSAQCTDERVNMVTP